MRSAAAYALNERALINKMFSFICSVYIYYIYIYEMREFRRSKKENCKTFESSANRERETPKLPNHHHHHHHHRHNHNQALSLC